MEGLIILGMAVMCLSVISSSLVGKKALVFLKNHDLKKLFKPANTIRILEFGIYITLSYFLAGRQNLLALSPSEYISICAALALYLLIRNFILFKTLSGKGIPKHHLRNILISRYLIEYGGLFMCISLIYDRS